jgi:hypothetical protein
MNLIDALKNLPEKRILQDKEFEEAYKILKNVFEKGNKDNTQKNEVLSFE